jgi:chemotaxis signal transduction protein
MSSFGLCLFERGCRRFALPVTAVREVLSGDAATPVPCGPAHLAGAISVRGEPLSLLLADPWIATPPRPHRAGDPVVVVESAGLRFGIVVDRLLEVRRFEREAVSQANEGEAIVEAWETPLGRVDVIIPERLVRAAVVASQQAFAALDGAGEEAP